jgi:hypothetical protein
MVEEMPGLESFNWARDLKMTRIVVEQQCGEVWGVKTVKTSDWVMNRINLVFPLF